MLQPNDGFLRINLSRGTSDLRTQAAGATQTKDDRVGAGAARLKARPDVTDEKSTLGRYYERLLAVLGPQGWWPARTRLEVILGAILTQNTTWNNAARAIAQLRERGVLSLSRLRGVEDAELQSLIRPAGFFKQKARAIREFLNWLDTAHAGSLDRMFAMPVGKLRSALLELKGVGPETTDAILLYAGGKAFFVADAYTRRILARHHLLPAQSSYEEAQDYIHRDLERDPGVYNEFHALLVEVGKRHCRRSTMECGDCPLEEFLPRARARRRDARVPMDSN